MNQMQADRLMKCMSSIASLDAVYKLLPSIEDISKKKGAKPEDVITLIYGMNLENWDNGTVNTLSVLCGQNHAMMTYCEMLSLYSNMVNDLLKENASFRLESRYTTMLACRFIISYIYKCLDIHTNLFSYMRFKANYDELSMRVKEYLPDAYDAVMVDIERKVQMPVEVQNYIKERHIDDKTLMSWYLKYSKHVVVFNDIFSDKSLEARYLACVTPDIKDAVDNFGDVITRSDIVTVVDKLERKELPDDVFLELEERISDRSESNTIVDDVQRLYDTVMSGESEFVRSADLGCMPLEVLSEALIKEKPTPALLDAANRSYNYDEHDKSKEFTSNA